VGREIISPFSVGMFARRRAVEVSPRLIAPGIPDVVPTPLQGPCRGPRSQSPNRSTQSPHSSIGDGVGGVRPEGGWAFFLLSHVLYARSAIPVLGSLRGAPRASLRPLPRIVPIGLRELVQLFSPLPFLALSSTRKPSSLSRSPTARREPSRVVAHTETDPVVRADGDCTDPFGDGLLNPF